MEVWLKYTVETKEEATEIAKYLKKTPFLTQKEIKVIETDEDEDSDDPPKKKRGRPAKAKPEDTDDPPKKKKRGRPKKEKPPTIDIGDIRKALKAYVEENDKDAVRAILKGFKVKKLSELDEDDYPALLAKLAEPVKTDEDDDEDDDFFDDED